MHSTRPSYEWRTLGKAIFRNKSHVSCDRPPPAGKQNLKGAWSLLRIIATLLTTYFGGKVRAISIDLPAERSKEIPGLSRSNCTPAQNSHRDKAAVCTVHYHCCFTIWTTTMGDHSLSLSLQWRGLPCNTPILQSCQFRDKMNVRRLIITLLLPESISKKVIKKFKEGYNFAALP